MIDPAPSRLVAERTMLSSRWARSQLVFVALAASSLVRCGCEDDPVFVPGAGYDPADTLNFGEVAVDKEKVLEIKVISNGGAALRLNSLTFPAANVASLAKFAFEGQACVPDAACTSLKSELLNPGIAPNTTSSITISYRPCPDAWNGNTLKVDYDFTSCPTEPDDVEMIINDNSRDQTHKFTISGQPAQRPQIRVFCNRAGSQCNQPIDSNATECTSLSFGSVTAGATPCDIELELRNVRREGKPTGALNVERLDIYVTDLVNLSAQVDGRDVGFSFRDEAGAPLVLPLEVPIAVGATEGKQKIKVRFDGSGNGTWVGPSREGRGVRIYHDDPDPAKRPVVGVTVTADGAAPQITVLPQAIDYGPVEQNTSRTATVVIGNAGSGELEIRDIRFAIDNTNNKFSVTTNRGMPPFNIAPNTFAGAQVYVRYTPVSAGQDRDELIIGSNDPNDNPIRVPLAGGATPRISVEPRDTLVIELENPPPPPPAPPRTRKVTITNVGFGDLVIQQLDLVGTDNDRMSTSLDDFTIRWGNPRQSCSAFPCPVSITLCPPSSPTCTSPSTDIDVVYLNNDNSTTDLAVLNIFSTDPANPIYPVVLNAEDRPCFSPSAVVMIDTANPTEGSEVCVQCNSSSPGGPPGMPAMIQSCDWSFAFASSSPIPTFAPNPGNRTCFTPTTAGLHIVSLTVTNTCGVASPAATEVLTIRSR